MSRERRVIETFVHLADTLVGVVDADDVLHVLAERCVELLNVDAAGVMVAMQPGEMKAVAATSHDMGQLEVFEVAAEEGPSHEAYTSGAAVIEHDLSSATSRWPMFTPRALELGFASAHGFPLRLRDRTIGALNLFQVVGRDQLLDDDALVARGFADVATISLLHEELVQDAESTVQQLQHALTNRVVVEQAKGVLAGRHGLAPKGALERLRGHARDHNRRLRDVAQDVIDGRIHHL